MSVRFSREYPSRPIIGVGAVIVMDGRVVLVKRRFEPLAGQWSLPGGTVEIGETLEAAVSREMLEETGLVVEVGPVIEVFDRITFDAERKVQYHFVLVDYLCWARGGHLAAASDVADTALVDPSDLSSYRLTEKAQSVIARGVSLADVAQAFRPAEPAGRSPERAALPERAYRTEYDMTMILSRDSAWALLTEYTQSENLRKHALAVEAAVRGYARMFGEDEELWGVTALLHDFDYERYPDLADHPFRGVEILKGLGYPEVVTRAILSHGDHTNVARESNLEHSLFACDEMAGFVTAAALVRPSKSVLDLEPSSVMKRMKDKAFARAVSREDLRKGADALGLQLDEHIGHVIRFMREKAEELGLRGTL